MGRVGFVWIGCLLALSFVYVAGAVARRAFVGHIFVPGRLTGRDGPFDHILLMPMFPDVPLSFPLALRFRSEVTEVAKTAGKIVLRTKRVNTDDRSAHGDLTIGNR